MHTITELIPILQTSIGPAILISAIGLLLLTMTNRMAHLIDRVRALNASADTGDRIHEEIHILWSRARLIRMAITLAASSALCSATLIVMIFLFTLVGIKSVFVIVLLFIASMVCFMGSIIVFISDVNKSLIALQIEIESNQKTK